MERVRAQGYAIDDEEYITGIKAVAVALNNRKGPPLAVWVVGLSNTMDATKIRQVTDVILLSTEKLRLALESSPTRDVSLTVFRMITINNGKYHYGSRSPLTTTPSVWASPYRSIFSYKVFLDIPRLCAVRLLFPWCLSRVF